MCSLMLFLSVGCWLAVVVVVYDVNFTLLLMLLSNDTGRYEACQWRCALSRCWRAGRPIDSQVPDIMSPPFSAPVTSNHINPAAQIRGQAVLLLFRETGRLLVHKGYLLILGIFCTLRLG